MAFELTESAKDEVQRRALARGLDNPVCTLGQRSSATFPTDDVRAALDSEDPGRELFKMGRKQRDLQADNINYALDVLLYEKKDIDDVLVTIVGGVHFALPAETMTALSGCLLDYQDDRFLLRFGGNS